MGINWKGLTRKILVKDTAIDNTQHMTVYPVFYSYHIMTVMAVYNIAYIYIQLAVYAQIIQYMPIDSVNDSYTVMHSYAIITQPITNIPHGKICKANQ